MSTAKKESWRHKLATNASDLKSRIRSGSRSSRDMSDAARNTPSPARGAANSTTPVTSLSKNADALTPSKNQDHLEPLPTSNVASTTPSEPSRGPRPNLLRVGYEAQKAENPALIQAYESILTAEYNSIPIDEPSGFSKLIDRQLETIEQQKWKLQIGSHTIVVREQVSRLVRAVIFAKDFITPVISSEPHAGFAWAGVCLFLPFLCNPEEQDQSLIDSLDGACSILFRFQVYERLYVEDMQSPDKLLMSPDVHVLRQQFEQGAIKLFSATIELQARAACYCSKNAAARYFRDVFKADNWASLAATIADHDRECMQYINALHAADFDQRTKSQSEKLDELCAAIPSITHLQTRLLQDVESGFAEQRRQYFESKYRELLDGLWTSSYENHKRNVPQRAPKTCEWFTRHPQYEAFKSTANSNILWLSGDPGCGKSVICRYLIDEDLVINKRTICYFFFREENPEQTTLDKALCALLHQLLIQHIGLSRYLFDVYNSKGRALTKSIKDLWASLISASSDGEAGEVVCVVDAIDECLSTDCIEFIRLLSDLYSSSSGLSSPGPKFLITSRPYRHINGSFQDLLSLIPDLQLSADSAISAISAETELFIDFRMSQIASTNDLSRETTASVLSRLKTEKSRTYLWLSLILQAVDNSLETSTDGLDHVISSLPETVYQAYGQILAQNRLGNMQETRKILQIMLAAQRPLLVSEMRFILALGHRDHQQPEADIKADKAFGDKIRYVCGLLVVINQDQLFFTHQTVREFLTIDSVDASVEPMLRDFGLPFSTSESHWILCSACSDIIKCEANWWKHPKKSGGSKSQLDKARVYQAPLSDLLAMNRGLMEYAATFWIHHAYQSTMEFLPEYGDEFEFATSESMMTSYHDKLFVTIVDICKSNQIWWSHAKLSKIYFGLFNGPRYGPAKWPAITTLAYFGFKDPLDRYLYTSKETNPVDVEDARGRTALSWAAERGFNGVAEILLKHGANVNASDHEGQTPLYYAVFAGANVHILDTMGEPYLKDLNEELHSVAFTTGSSRSTDSGPGESQSDDYFSESDSNDETKRARCLQLLLDYGAYDSISLYAAIWQGDQATADFLMSRGIDLIDIDWIDADDNDWHVLLDRLTMYRDCRFFVRWCWNLLDNDDGFRFSFREIVQMWALGEREFITKVKERYTNEGHWDRSWIDFFAFHQLLIGQPLDYDQDFEPPAGKDALQTWYISDADSSIIFLEEVPLKNSQEHENNREEHDLREDDNLGDSNGPRQRPIVSLMPHLMRSVCPYTFPHLTAPTPYVPPGAKLKVKSIQFAANVRNSPAVKKSRHEEVEQQWDHHASMRPVFQIERIGGEPDLVFDSRSYLNPWGFQTSLPSWNGSIFMRLQGTIAREGHDILDAPLVGSRTVLHVAAEHGGWSPIQSLLFLGARAFVSYGSKSDALFYMVDDEHKVCLDLACCAHDRAHLNAVWSWDGPRPSASRLRIRGVTRPKIAIPIATRPSRRTVDDLALLSSGRNRLSWLSSSTIHYGISIHQKLEIVQVDYPKQSFDIPKLAAPV